MANKKKKKNIFEEAIEETLANKKQTTTNKNSKRNFIDSGANDIAPVKTTTQSGTFSDFTKNAVKDLITDRLKINEFKDIWSNGYQFGDIKNTLQTARTIIDPVAQVQEKAKKAVEDIASSDGKLFKESKAIKDTKDTLKNVWSDGYNVGDIFKSGNAIRSGISKTILGTTTDVGTNLLKGELQTAEGLVDTGRYIASDLVRATGFDETADKIKERAIQNTTGFILGENDLYNNPIENGWAKKIDEYSVFDQKIDQINQSVGQQAFRIGLQKALMGKAPEGGATDKLVKGLNQLEIFAGSYGQAKSEAYMNGADDKTATIRGMVSGTTEYISENLFDSLPGFKTYEAKGITKLKNIIGDGAEKSFGKKSGKLVLQLFNGLGEGTEEVLSNVLDTTFTDVLNYIMPEYTYGMKEGQGIRNTEGLPIWKQIKDIYESATSDESKEAFITSMISTFITSAATDYANTQQRNQIIDAWAEDNDFSKEKAHELFDAISQLRQNQLVDETTGFTERMDIEQNVNQQLQQEVANGANLEELFKVTPKSRQESQFIFTNDERKNIKSDKQKNIANEMSRLNNTKDVHDTYEIANRMQGINDTHQYHVTTTEGLVELGIVIKDVNGNYGMINDKGEFIPYVPRGMNYGKNGDIYLNADVGTKSGTQAMYHEIFEGFKKANDKSYKELKQMVRDIVGEEAIQKEIPLYKQMYGEDYTDIEDEIINDKFGEIAENQKFINRIADNRSVLEKFVDSIKNMIKYVKGTPQERQLIKLQNKLEKEFAKRYKKTDFSQSKNGEDAFSIVGIKGAINSATTEEELNTIMNNYNNALDYINNNQNISNEDLIRYTGWFRDIVGDLKTEIDDSYYNLKNIDNLKSNKHAKVGDIIKHDLLYKLYPDYKNVDIIVEDGGRVYYDKYNNQIKIGDRFLNNKSQADLEEALLHETQHYIQTIEDFSPGGFDRIGKLSFRALYYNLLGEAEAVDTANRRKLTSEQREQILPESAKENYINQKQELYQKDFTKLDRFVDKLFKDGIISRKGLNNFKKGFDQLLKVEDKIEKKSKKSSKSSSNNINNTYYNDMVNIGEEGTQQKAVNNTAFSLDRNNYNEEQIKEIEKQMSKYVGMTKDQLNKEWKYASDSYDEMIKISNDLQKQYKELQGTQEWLDALHNYDFDSEAWLKGDEFANKIRYYNKEQDKYFAQREAINELLNGNQEETRSAKQIVKDAEKHFGITNDFKETAYITTNGNQLDFSGHHEGGMKGHRGLDHREIGEIDTDMNTFISQGNIRVLPESGGINLEIEPNAKQYEKLADYIEYAKDNHDEIYVDVIVGDGSYDSTNYNKNTPTSKIINDIKEYFKTGQFPQKSRYSDFYSLAPTQDNKGRTLTKEQQDFYKNVAPELRDENGNIKTYYHGTRRADRVGNYFDPSRATSGPMAYFTDNEEIGKGYAEGKADTSLSREYDTEYDLFKVNNKTLDEYWDSLSQEQKNKINQEGYNIGFDEDFENIIYDKDASKNSFGDMYDWYLNHKHNNNGIKALYDLWIEDGNIFGYTEKFKDVLEKAGLKDVEYLDPYKVDSKVYETYLNITNPFDTSNISEDILNQLKETAKNVKFEELPYMADAWDKTNINPQDWIARLEQDIKDETTYTWTSIPDWVTDVLKQNGYDGIVDTGGKYGRVGHQVAIPFYSNQIKNVDNLNPTEDVDIRKSLTSNKNIDSKEIAPVNSTLIQEQLTNLSNQMEDLLNQLENMQKGYVETTGDTRYDRQSYNAMTEEEANMYQDAITNDEGYMKSLSEQDIDTNANLINTLTNDIQAQLDVNKYNRPALEKVIRDAVENKLSSTEIAHKLSPFTTYEETFEREGLKQVKKDIREMPIKVPDVVKRNIADYGKWKQSNFGKITFSNHGQGIDQVYYELCDLYPEYFSEDIINDTDQLLRIAEVVNLKNVQSTTNEYDWDYVESVADYIENYILNDQYKTQKESQASLEKDIQFDFTEDIAPTTIRSQESVDDYIENRDIAPVNPKVAEKQKSPYRQRVDRMWNTLQEMFVNRNHIIDEFARATGNNEIKFAGDNLNNVSGETGFNVNSHQTDINGNWVGKSVHDIFAPAKKAGLYNAFNDYLIQKSNIERHAVGKGSQVPLAVSQQLVQQYETENPQFKEWAKDVYKYFDNILQEQVDAGLITQEKYNDYRGEDGIYRSYVPFYEGELDIKRFFDDDGNLRPYTTLKKSKGNATDVNKLLSVEESMARQTYAQKRAIRQNMLFGQIVNSLDKYTDAMDMDVRNEPTNLDDNLYTTENGDKVLSAYVNGEKVSAIISDELYNELSQANENRVKQLEQDFSLITKPLQSMSNVRRNLITTWNPIFLARNAIKDIQDAVINSKHTGSMLKNYYGLNKSHTPAIMELAQAKTQEAQQFLALYGSDAMLGDYSKTNKFTKLNELIELAPRYAEFKASLEAGESVNEAIYNAREVTTNFGRGGYITKAMNRNGFTFLNANVQGLDKLVRNLSGQNGVKGVASVVTKGALFSILPAILNHMMYGGSGDDKDEEYEALPDYVKDNYYLIKLEDGNFLRIPKGRINAVFGSLARRLIETGETGENQLKGWGENAWSQIGVGDANGLQTIFTPINEAINNKAWHGGDIVPTRLQSKPAGEQSDEKTDYISKTLGELFNVSPKKINYVLDQYSGGIGDLLLPMITPASQNGAEGLEYLTSPVKDAFVVNSTDDNKYAGDFYELKEELEIKKNGSNATDDDVIKYNYLSSVSSKMSDLYKEKREVQSDTELSNSEKYKKVQNIQNEINNLAKNALNNYKNVSGTDTFKQVEDTQYYKNNKNSWSKVSDSDDEFTAGMTQTEKASYFNTKNKISDIKSNDKLSYANKKEKITNAIVNSGLDDYSKAMLYAKNYSSEKKMNNVYNAGYDIDTYINAISDIDQLRDKYQVKKGYSVEFRKKKTISYVNSLNMEIPQKAMLIREYYSSFRDYNNQIVNYVANLDLTYDEKKAILEGTGMKVKGNNVSWK